MDKGIAIMSGDACGMPACQPLTEWIGSAQNGDEAALNRVFSATYQELHRRARARLRQLPGQPALNATSLVHESFLKFCSAGELRVNDREHFLCYASRVMRSIIVDCVRERRAQRRGGGLLQVTLSTAIGDALIGEEQILHVHEALEELAMLDSRLVQVVEMRYFSGMTETEIALVLKVTDRTVRRYWEKARLLLANSLGTTAPVD